MADNVSLSPNLISWKVSEKKVSPGTKRCKHSYRHCDGVVFVHYRDRTCIEELVDGVLSVLVLCPLKVPSAAKAHGRTRKHTSAMVVLVRSI